MLLRNEGRWNSLKKICFLIILASVILTGCWKTTNAVIIFITPTIVEMMEDAEEVPTESDQVSDQSDSR